MKSWDLDLCIPLALYSKASLLSSPSLPDCVTAAFGTAVSCNGLCCDSWWAWPYHKGVATLWVCGSSMKFLPSLPPSYPPHFLFNYFYGHLLILKERDKNLKSLGSACGTNSRHLLLLCYLLCMCVLSLPPLVSSFSLHVLFASL